jgi:hypothetical protein
VERSIFVIDVLICGKAILLNKQTVFESWNRMEFGIQKSTKSDSLTFKKVIQLSSQRPKILETMNFWKLTGNGRFVSNTFFGNFERTL